MNPIRSCVLARRLGESGEWGPGKVLLRCGCFWLGCGDMEFVVCGFFGMVWILEGGFFSFLGRVSWFCGFGVGVFGCFLICFFVFSSIPSTHSSPFSLLPSPFSLLPSPFSLLPSPFSLPLPLPSQHPKPPTLMRKTGTRNIFKSKESVWRCAWYWIFGLGCKILGFGELGLWRVGFGETELEEMKVFWNLGVWRAEEANRPFVSPPPFTTVAIWYSSTHTNISYFPLPVPRRKILQLTLLARKSPS